MNRISLPLVGATLLALATTGFGEDMACGTTDSWADKMVTQYLIPETFPFDEKITASLAPAISSLYLKSQECREFGTAYWSPSCLEHDRCMEAIGMYGKSSDACHTDLLNGWKAACSGKFGLTQDDIAKTQQGWGSTGFQLTLSRKLTCEALCHDAATIAHKIMAGAASSFPAAEKLIADVNNNGVSDAVIFPKTNRMYVDLEMKRGAKKVATPVDVWPSKFYKVGDFNGDNRDDVLMLVQGQDYTHPYYSNGDGTFSVSYFKPWLGYGIGDPANYHVGDFNNDNIDDLIHFVPGLDYVNIWYGTRSNTFSMVSFRPWVGYAMDGKRIKVGDFDGDGYKDDFVDFVGTYVHTWRGNGNGTFSIGTWKPWEGYAFGNASDYKIVDFDQNKIDDLYHPAPGWKWFGHLNFLSAGFFVAKVQFADLARIYPSPGLPY